MQEETLHNFFQGRPLIINPYEVSNN